MSIDYSSSRYRYFSGIDTGSGNTKLTTAIGNTVKYTNVIEKDKFGDIHILTTPGIINVSFSYYFFDNESCCIQGVPDQPSQAFFRETIGLR
mgnify:CR=1 FL=1